MALTTPSTAKEVSDRAVNDVAASLASVGGKPSLKNSWINSLIVAISNRIFDFYFSLTQAVLEALPDTAVDLLERWGAIWAIIRIPGAVATGNAVASGTLTSVIPENATLVTGDGKEYTNTASSTITAKSIAVPATQLTFLAGVVTCEFSPTKHGLGSQVLISITGAVETDYNVTDQAITITSATAFTFPITPTPSTPATGSPLVAFNSAVLVLDSVVFASTEDQIFDAALQFESPIVGVDNIARVDFDGLGGGADREVDSLLRGRLLDRIQNPIAHFNAAEIESVAKTVAGVTRVFVQEITPAVGQVTIYFMRDNDATSIPSGAEVAAVNTLIQAIRPATSDVADVIVAAPGETSTNFTFTALSPDTTTMRLAIEASLAQFYAEHPQVGVNIESDAYRSAIFNTVDTTNGDVIVSFTLTPDPSTISIASGFIGTLGNVTFSI